MYMVNSGRFTVGERLEMSRRRRGLSRKVVAELVGRSEEWLRTVETGRRRLDSIETITRLARVLDIADPGELVDRPPWSKEKGHRGIAELAVLRRAVIDHPALRVYHRQQDFEQIDPEWAAAALRLCNRAWASSPRRYSVLAQHLPRTLTASRLIRWQRRDAATAGLLIWAYHLARRLATASGDHRLAAVVADRAMGTSAQVHNRALVAASAWHLSHAFAGLGHPQEAHDYALSAAGRLGGGSAADTEQRTLWGALHLVAARAAIGARDPAESARLLGLAERVAAESTTDTFAFGIPFGPVQFGTTRVEIALDCNDPAQALRLAAEVEIPDDYPIGYQVRHHIHLACAYCARDDEVATAFMLNKATAISPEDVRHHAGAQRCLRYLRDCDNPLIRPEVTKLSDLVYAR
ncbi:helix-turn-helix domain-containing protein [Nocardia wallacei]|uniref:helix-turn-helix domain-containing protein n=1 Tax=Nocardia wallacei TaxID=480035 RepID=UPI0024576675|nr:helix-turn-helix domain-containing protein [Nocardia wallacei]